VEGATAISMKMEKQDMRRNSQDVYFYTLTIQAPTQSQLQ
jgi:hypothetical protein